MDVQVPCEESQANDYVADRVAHVHSALHATSAFRTGELTRGLRISSSGLMYSRAEHHHSSKLYYCLR
ncbi:hypothetical protein V496_01568 [Pseudogymnoascus sp. VKM F-4515 (FW-2607)]|nr:hypothetical protein V496_01568 [Pseudogymnoascus sp. VKM F-4515 (FW-2607)]